MFYFKLFYIGCVNRILFFFFLGTVRLLTKFQDIALIAFSFLSGIWTCQSLCATPRPAPTHMTSLPCQTTMEEWEVVTVSQCLYFFLLNFESLLEPTLHYPSTSRCHTELFSILCYFQPHSYSFARKVCLVIKHSQCQQMVCWTATVPPWTRQSLTLQYGKVPHISLFSVDSLTSFLLFFFLLCFRENCSDRSSAG